MTRRAKGEGGISRRHDHPTCPPRGEDGTIPDHACKGRWSAQMELPRAPDGSRRRLVLYGRTKQEVAAKLRDRMLTARPGVGVDKGADP